ncbi:hypothetical protein MTF68_13825 [Pseudoalteromonas sp. 2CM37A]|uniref:hypothetical protein n=1 Tax=Pseudoalteromonas sp. 2CM37A TaxID=2929853 RepID=UPI0020C09708|nr:hypothetical protein [Pseudoalteromonas sp. 2CM37A]MCK8118637.1 hypothetical protein [Pseudoalteromonas sp. 2CM37A]
MANNSGGAAMNAGADFQQRVASYFLIQMALGNNCAEVLESIVYDKRVLKVAFETDDAVDDIVLTHSKSKTYLQVKRKLSLSDADESDFLKTIEQLVRQNKESQNSEDSYVVITSNETSLPIKKHLKKMVNSARLNANSISQDPMSSPELAAYGKLKRCIEKSYSKNNLGSPSKKDIQRLLSKIYIVVLDVEKDGINEKSFLESLLNKFSVEPSVIWNLVIAQALDWAKNRQSVDSDGIVNLLSKFRVDDPEPRNEDLDNFFKVKFDPDNFSISSGKEWVLMESKDPNYNYVVAELIRFDEKGEFKATFKEDSVVMRTGIEYKLYARFSTFQGVERYLQEFPVFSEKLLITQVSSNENDEHNNTPLAKAYSEKVRNHIIESNDATICIHCEHGLSYPSFVIEVQEDGIPFDAGSIHPNCLRPSDRIIGIMSGEHVSKYPELNNFDFNKWISLLENSQGLWAGIKAYPNTRQLRTVLWNSEPEGNVKGGFCIKINLKNGSSQYVQERGKVQRYNEQVALDVCSRLEKWRIDSKAQNSPLCYSSDGGLQGMKKEIQSNYINPIDLVECDSFNVVTYTRGIGAKYDKLNNYYAPLIVFMNTETGKYLTQEDTVFLITDPSELKVYLENWLEVELSPKAYRLDIIKTDAEFDKFMHWSKQNEISVFVDPFFNDEKKLIRGSIIEDLAELKKENEYVEEDEVGRFSLLFTKENGDGTFTQLYRDFVNDVTLLLNDKCTSDDCKCMGCQMYDIRIAHYGKDNVDIRQSNENTIVLNLIDSESEWTQEFIENHCVDWDYWEPLVT